jgi:hypothetical protein
MNEARASHINANQGTIKAVNTWKLGQQNKAIRYDLKVGSEYQVVWLSKSESYGGREGGHCAS